MIQLTQSIGVVWLAVIAGVVVGLLFISLVAALGGRLGWYDRTVNGAILVSAVISLPALFLVVAPIYSHNAESFRKAYPQVVITEELRGALADRMTGIYKTFDKDSGKDRLVAYRVVIKDNTATVYGSPTDEDETIIQPEQ